LQRGQHRLVVLFLVLNDHARREQLAGRSVLDQVKDPPANLVVVGPRLNRGQQRQRRALGAGVLECVVERVHRWREHPGPDRVAGPQQPQLLLLADVRQVPHQRAHQQVVLRDQRRVVQVRQLQRPVSGLLKVADDKIMHMPSLPVRRAGRSRPRARPASRRDSDPTQQDQRGRPRPA
jgi:hypothetical protein